LGRLGPKGLNPVRLLALKLSKMDEADSNPEYFEICIPKAARNYRFSFMLNE